MNLILFEPGEWDSPLPRSDPRAAHLLGILKRVRGDQFDAGIVDGPRGKGTVVSIGPEVIRVAFEPTEPGVPADCVHLLLAIPRPQTARKILSEATSLGVASMRFFRSEKGEAGYASSTLWKTKEWRQRLLEGAAQAFDTRIPDIFHDLSLQQSVAALPAFGARIALDNYEATGRLSAAASRPVVLAFGPERGWSGTERELLRAAGFKLAHLGPRVLRTETAVVAALSVLKSAP